LRDNLRKENILPDVHAGKDALCHCQVPDGGISFFGTLSIIMVYLKRKGQEKGELV